MKIQNARILKTYLGLEDHGILTAMVIVEAQTGGGGFGGYDLRHHGINYLKKLLSALCVSKWEALPGQYVRVVSNGCGSRWTAIGHIVQDRWFVCDEDGPRVVTEADLPKG